MHVPGVFKISETCTSDQAWGATVFKSMLMGMGSKPSATDGPYYILQYIAWHCSAPDIANACDPVMPTYYLHTVPSYSRHRPNMRAALPTNLESTTICKQT